MRYYRNNYAPHLLWVIVLVLIIVKLLLQIHHYARN